MSASASTHARGEPEAWQVRRSGGTSGDGGAQGHPAVLFDTATSGQKNARIAPGTSSARPPLRRSAGLADSQDLDGGLGDFGGLRRINLGLPFLSSLPYHTEINVQPAFSANINGAPLTLTGDSRPFSETRESILNLDLDRFDIGALAAYLPKSLPVDLRSAWLDTELRIFFKERPELAFSLTVEGAAHLSEVTIIERKGAPLVAWKRLDVELESIDAITQRVAIKRVVLDGLDLSLTVDRQGEFNVLKLADSLAGLPDKGSTQGDAPRSKVLWDGQSTKLC